MKRVALTMSVQERDYYLRKRYISYLTDHCRTVMPIILPPTNDIDTIREYALVADGLILTGGGDIDPLLYGEQKEKACVDVHRLRDEFEITLTREMLSLEKPIFGICRGIQVINVALGGTLWQDIDVKSHVDTRSDVPSHTVRLSGKLAKFFGCDSILTNSYHHQSVKSLRNGLDAVAHSTDGHIEAVWGEGYPFLCGVQWHPEMEREGNSARLIREFLKII